MSKNIQISMELFKALCAWHIGKPLPEDLIDLDKTDPQLAEDELARRIADGLNAKYSAVERRRAYSAYKDMSQPTEQREAARKAYLDAVGVPEDFRY